MKKKEWYHCWNIDLSKQFDQRTKKKNEFHFVHFGTFVIIIITDTTGKEDIRERERKKKTCDFFVFCI